MRSTQLNSTQLNSTQLNSTQLNSTQLNSTQLNSTQLNSTQLNASCFNSCLMKVALLSLVVLLSPAQAVLNIYISPDGSGNAVMLITGSGSTTSTTLGGWDDGGSGGFNGDVTTNYFNSFFNGANTSLNYANQDFEIDGFQVTAGSQTLTLDRFTFEDDGSAHDDFSLGFGDGTARTIWDTDGEGVGAISVLETAWQTIRFRDTTTFANSPGEALVFTDNFNVGTYTFNPNTANVFWGGSNTDGITLIISGDVIPEPTSALLLLLLLPSLLLKRKRFC